MRKQWNIFCRMSLAIVIVFLGIFVMYRGELFLRWQLHKLTNAKDLAEQIDFANETVDMVRNSRVNKSAIYEIISDPKISDEVRSLLIPSIFVKPIDMLKLKTLALKLGNFPSRNYVSLYNLVFYAFKNDQSDLAWEALAAFEKCSPSESQCLIYFLSGLREVPHSQISRGIETLKCINNRSKEDFKLCELTLQFWYSDGKVTTTTLSELVK